MSARKMTHEEFINKCNLREDINEYEIISIYKDSRTKIDIKHKGCNKEFSMRPNNFYSKKQKCPHCYSGSKIRKLSYNEIKDRIKLQGNDEYILLDDKYINGKIKLNLLHKTCNNKIQITWNDFNTGYRCAYCAGNKKLKYDDLNKKIKELDNDYELVENKNDKDNYQTVHSIIHIRHLICERVFEKSFNNFRNGQRCTLCSNEMAKSKAQLNIENYLRENNIKFREEVMFDDLRNPKTNKKLRIDLYLEDYNIYIEFDGKQHYEYSKKGLFTRKEFDEIKYRDTLKDEYCEKNNLKLYRINYKENEIEALKKILSSTTIETKRCETVGRE